jgi:periplasmic copper chaperone A
MKTKTILAIGGAALVLPAAASAHVSVNPNKVPADSFARFDVRVPNEQETADTTKVAVQLPEGLVFTSFQPKPGWTRTTTTAKLAQPVTSDDGTITERVATVTWSGGKIAPREFDEFGFTAKVPDTVGKVLVFPSVQTYSNGDVVRWIGSADADEPAPRVTLEAKEAESHAMTTTTAPTVNVSGADTGNDRATVAIVLGVIGILVGVAALGAAFVGRRRTA